METDYRDEIFSLIDEAKQDAKRILEQFPRLEICDDPEFQKVCETDPHTSDDPTKEAIINYLRRWFIFLFEDGEKPESLAPSDYNLWLEVDKAKAALCLLELIPSVKYRLNQELDDDLLKLGAMFMTGFIYGSMISDSNATHPHTKRSWASLLGSRAMLERWRNDKSKKQKQKRREAAEPAIQWMLKRWGKGEEADHAAFTAHVYSRKEDVFHLQEQGVTLEEFRSWVKDAAKKDYPHKVRGLKKPPAL